MGLVASIGLLALAMFGFTRAIRKFRDGPLGPFAGGALRAGTFVDEQEVDWALADQKGRVQLAELQLLEPLGSRKTGVQVYQGDLYVPCDLGVIWRRIPLHFRGIMLLVWCVKRWHQDAVKDGRVVIRIQGKRYARQAVRVEDPEIVEALQAMAERQAEVFFGAPLTGERPASETMWFFRLDPRSQNV